MTLIKISVIPFLICDKSAIFGVKFVKTLIEVKPKRMKLFIISFLLALGISTHAQIEKTIHQTFVLKDEVQDVALDIFDEFETETWAGNTVMAVTQVELHSGAQHVLDFYIKEGRYEMELVGNEGSVQLVSKDKKRKGMKYKGMVIFEQVKMKMYIPETFELVGKNKLVRKPEETASTDQ